MNLAVSDILFATFITPKVIVSFNLSHPDGVAGSVLCKLLTGGNLAWLPGISSVVTLVAMAVERYYTVVYPLDQSRKLTKRKLKVSLSITRLLSRRGREWLQSLPILLPILLFSVAINLSLRQFFDKV